MPSMRGAKSWVEDLAIKLLYSLADSKGTNNSTQLSPNFWYRILGILLMRKLDIQRHRAAFQNPTCVKQREPSTGFDSATGTSGVAEQPRELAVMQQRPHVPLN